jgi:hypothetical protein
MDDTIKLNQMLTRMGLTPTTTNIGDTLPEDPSTGEHHVANRWVIHVTVEGDMVTTMVQLNQLMTLGKGGPTQMGMGTVTVNPE